MRLEKPQLRRFRFHLNVNSGIYYFVMKTPLALPLFVSLALHAQSPNSRAAVIEKEREAKDDYGYGNAKRGVHWNVRNLSQGRGNGGQTNGGN